MNPADIFHHRISKLESRARRSHAAPTIPKYSIAIPMGSGGESPRTIPVFTYNGSNTLTASLVGKIGNNYRLFGRKTDYLTIANNDALSTGALQTWTINTIAGSAGQKFVGFLYNQSYGWFMGCTTYQIGSTVSPADPVTWTATTNQIVAEFPSVSGNQYWVRGYGYTNYTNGGGGYNGFSETGDGGTIQAWMDNFGLWPTVNNMFVFLEEDDAGGNFLNFPSCALVQRPSNEIIPFIPLS